MELTSDWKGFQSVFYPRRRSLAKQDKLAVFPAYVLLENGSVVSVFAEGEDLSEWIGTSQDELMAGLGTTRTIVFLERPDMDRWMAGSLGMTHFVEQAEYMRECSAESIRALGVLGKQLQADELLFHRHFFLEAIRGWWSKVLPSAFGVLVRLEGQPSEDLFVLVRRGRIESYGRPDLGILGTGRGSDSEAIVKYLSEKHMVPVQGFFMSSQEWLEWSDSPQPWRKVAMSIRAERTKLIPFRWGLVGMIAGRGFLGL